MRTETKYFGWSWNEVDTAEQAAYAETWIYDDANNVVSRERVQGFGKKSGKTTISTDPRAGQIMREELGMVPRERGMGGPHW